MASVNQKDLAAAMWIKYGEAIIVGLCSLDSEDLKPALKAVFARRPEVMDVILEIRAEEA